MALPPASGRHFRAQRRPGDPTVTNATLKPRPARARPAARWSDVELVEACRRGDPAGWDEMVDRYGRLVHSIARRQGLDDADAQDVFQQVFAIAHRRLGSLRDAARLPSWLFTTALREC